MKLTTRDEWRVVIEIRPRYTHTPISALGFTNLDYDLDGQIDGDPFELTIAPRRLGDFGYMSMGDQLVSRDIDAAYKQRCEAMLTELLRAPHVRGGRVTCTETHTCSHCHLLWEVLTADEAADDSTNQDEHSVEGEPVCCDKAIAEFRTERSIPALGGGS
ncbi:hypothetical protein OG596_26590 [Streptomyces sp. NBC_01102]|uniref:hypothetical protein n=1 Tax=Streptomyces sp. NBC_01102 TaxID=2903749 RepID=UPI0038708EEA|nr:hypothetical protein OG596_26590 [Streptomyces sp. NBC_01102]